MTLTQTLSFDRFLAPYGDDHRYELAETQLIWSRLAPMKLSLARRFSLGQMIQSPLFPNLQIRRDDLLPQSA